MVFTVKAPVAIDLKSDRNITNFSGLGWYDLPKTGDAWPTVPKVFLNA